MLDLEPAIERSRSGNGAHVWLFFSDSIAADARRLGFSILTEAMVRGAGLSVTSYDRLFPSQDVLPMGGFGNLIALPLQREARKLGNTEFLDEELEPHPDQWSFLASVPKIAPDRLAGLIADSGADHVLAVNPSTERPKLPWRRSRTLADRLGGTAMPHTVEATVAERLYIDRTGLPAPLVDAMRRLATFPNPMFMEMQGMRMSVARTPRVVACWVNISRFRVGVWMTSKHSLPSSMSHSRYSYGHIVIDEGHHVPPVSIERVLAAIPARYITGLTATPYRRDGHQPIIAMQCARSVISSTPRTRSNSTRSSCAS